MSKSKVKQKKERRKPVWILFFKEAIFPQGTHSNGCLFSKPRLFLSDFSKDANLSETGWDFVYESFISQPRNAACASWPPILPVRFADNIHWILLHCTISESATLIPTAWPEQKFRVGAFEIERWKYQIALRGIARVGIEREWGGSPLASAEAGTLMHAWNPRQESS